MLKGFNQFILEARGFSNTVAEYATIAEKKIMADLERYAAFKFKKGFTNFSKDVLIDNAYQEVSQKAAGDFPIDELMIILRIAAVDQKDPIPYDAHYQRNYNKVRLVRGRGEKVKLEIYCKFTVHRHGEKVDLSEIKGYLTDILQHEITHAYNDYKDPNFLRNYRLGLMNRYTAQAYPYLMKAPTLKTFFDLLYVLTDEEIKAIAGERAEFKDQDELRKYNGYKWSALAREFDAEEYREVILSQLADSPYADYMDQKFGEFFVKNYIQSVPSKTIKIDPKILKLKDSANLLDVLRYFEPYINSRGEYLYRKLAAKVSGSGEGSFKALGI